ncbi:uncharacterized protein LOC141855077 [Brevipalpus obovatus]|uniref:uncharacterized protein LOC141855077 n=1 Tax=Brevipalpus obovatus TaxID=246614 RepID=UPI003D9DED21
MTATSSKILVPVLLLIRVASITETYDKLTRNEDNCYWSREGCSRLGPTKFHDKFDDQKRKNTRNFQYMRSPSHGAYEAGFRRGRNDDGFFERLERSNGKRHRGDVEWKRDGGRHRGKQTWDINKPIINGKMEMLGVQIHLMINNLTRNGESRQPAKKKKANRGYHQAY